MKSFVLAATLAVAAANVYACSHSHDADGHAHTSVYPTCEKIIDACHDYDLGEGQVHDCHDLAHDAKDDASCASKLADCLRVCAASADATGPDGGAPTGDR